MEIRNSIQKSFDMYFKNFGALFLACLIGGITSAVTFGILAGPLVGAVLVLCLKLLHGEKGEIKEILAHFDQFLPTLTVTLMLWVAGVILWIISMIPFLGWMITLVVSPALGMLYFLTIGFVVEQKMKPLESFRRSIDCFAFQPFMSWLYSLVMMIMAWIGVFFFIIPVFLTIPLGVVGLTIAYRRFSTSEVPPYKPGQQAIRIAGIALTVLFIGGLVCLTFGLGRNP